MSKVQIWIRRRGKNVGSWPGKMMLRIRNTVLQWVLGPSRRGGGWFQGPEPRRTLKYETSTEKDCFLLPAQGEWCCSSIDRNTVILYQLACNKYYCTEKVRKRSFLKLNGTWFLDARETLNISSDKNLCSIEFSIGFFSHIFRKSQKQAIQSYGLF